LEKAEGLAELGGRTLQVDGYHLSFALLRKADGQWTPVAFAPEDQLDKYLLWHHVASLVQKHRADAVLFVGEFWAAPVPRPGKPPPIDLEHAPGRREQLIVFVETAAGVRRAWMTPFHHRLGRVILEERYVEDDFVPPMLEPVREVWRSGFDTSQAEGTRRVVVATRPTESRLVDRVRASGIHVPAEVRPDPDTVLALIAQAPTFVIDDVALYLAASSSEVLVDLGSLPDMQLTALPADFFMESVKPILSLANPFPSAWGVACEYRTAVELREDERRRSFTHPDVVWEKILELVDAYEWTLTASLIVEHVPYRAVGPVAHGFFGIRPNGQGRLLAFNPGATGEVLGVGEADASSLAKALLAPMTAAIQLLNRGIARRIRFSPKRAARRRHQREHGVPLTPYEVISVEVPLGREVSN
jgi:hypothetical protein